MNLRELKALLNANREKGLLLRLPSQNPVPVSFHITEVGQVSKRFVDCGGAVHSVQTCQLQAWVGDDEDHRLNAGKISDILKLAQALLPSDDVEVEIEYEDRLLSQYPIIEHTITEDTVTLHLTNKHTDCLAKDKCLVPTPTGTACCGPNCC